MIYDFAVAARPQMYSHAAAPNPSGLNEFVACLSRLAISAAGFNLPLQTAHHMLLQPGS
jgi:hypothetical protein